VEKARAGDIIAIVSGATPDRRHMCDAANPVSSRDACVPGPRHQRVGEVEGQGEQEKFGERSAKNGPAPIPSLTWETDRRTGQTILRGMGELWGAHFLVRSRDRMRTEFGAKGTNGRAASRVSETFTRSDRTDIHKKQPGFAARFAEGGSFSSSLDAERDSEFGR